MKKKLNKKQTDAAKWFDSHVIVAGSEVSKEFQKALQKKMREALVKKAGERK